MTTRPDGVEQLVVGKLYRIARECTVTVFDWISNDPNSSAARLGVVGRQFQFMVLANPVERNSMHTSGVLVLASDGSTGYLRTGTVNNVNLKYEPLGLLHAVEEIT